MNQLAFRSRPGAFRPGECTCGGPVCLRSGRAWIKREPACRGENDASGYLYLRRVRRVGERKGGCWRCVRLSGRCPPELTLSRVEGFPRAHRKYRNLIAACIAYEEHDLVWLKRTDPGPTIGLGTGPPVATLPGAGICRSLPDGKLTRWLAEAVSMV